MLLIPKDKIGSIETSLENRGDFGWETFTLADKESKEDYLFAAIKSCVADSTSPELATVIGRALSGTTMTEEDAKNSYIDHQSFIPLPRKFGYPDSIDVDFIKDYRDYVLREDLIVLGGNDNEGEHPLAGKKSDEPPLPREASPLTARKDIKNDYWTLFNKETGAKLRMSFSANDFKAPMKAEAPELVDLKITSRCSAGCAYCYTDSKPEDPHGDNTYIRNIISRLIDLSVFEVAIGGGEPTEHPNFVSFLEQLKDGGIVANFTTKSFAWIKDEEQRIPILASCGAFAYSVDSISQLERLVNYVAKYDIPRNKVNIQIVNSIHREDFYSEVFETAKTNKFRVTLLGFKEVGRGTTYKSRIPVWDSPGKGCELFWLKALKSLVVKNGYDIPYISIDTLMASQFSKELKEAGIPSHTYHTHEGSFSMYIDAVKKKAGPSSYHEKELVDFASLKEAWDSVKPTMGCSLETKMVF